MITEARSRRVATEGESSVYLKINKLELSNLKN